MKQGIPIHDSLVLRAAVSSGVYTLVIKLMQRTLSCIMNLRLILLFIIARVASFWANQRLFGGIRPEDPTMWLTAAGTTPVPWLFPLNFLPLAHSLRLSVVSGSVTLSLTLRSPHCPALHWLPRGGFRCWWPHPTLFCNLQLPSGWDAHVHRFCLFACIIIDEIEYFLLLLP
jgi:hypothetical protein